jgi:hypothetical protein
MRKFALITLLLFHSLMLVAQRSGPVRPEAAKEGFIVTIIIFSIVFGAALILYIKQRMDEE